MSALLNYDGRLLKAVLDKNGLTEAVDLDLFIVEWLCPERDLFEVEITLLVSPNWVLLGCLLSGLSEALEAAPGAFFCWTALNCWVLGCFVTVLMLAIRLGLRPQETWRWTMFSASCSALDLEEPSDSEITCISLSTLVFYGL